MRTSMKSKKFIWYGAFILITIGAIGLTISKNGDTSQEVFVVRPIDFVQQVSVSGKVVATESLDLSFEQTGLIASVPVKVGESVTVGQLLSSQNTSQLEAQLAETQANIDVQRAKLSQLLAGISSEDIAVAQTQVANAKTSIDNAVEDLENAKQNIIDNLQDAYTKTDDAIRNKTDQFFSNPRSSNPQLTFILADSQLEIDLEQERFLIEEIMKIWKSSLDELTLSSNLSSSISETKQNVGLVKSFLDKAAFAIHSLTPSFSLTQATIDKWKTDIGTARANINTATINITSAQEELKTEEADLKTAEGNLKKAQDELAVKKSPARPADIALYEAQIRGAEASAQNVIAQLQKKQIHSPINGVVTIVHAKVGSIFIAQETALSLIGPNTLQIESYVPEVNIPLITIGDSSTVTLDAYGDNIPFEANVISIDPAETIRDGVSTYRIKLQFLNRDEHVKSGMSANIFITTEKKANTIAIPQGMIIRKDGQNYVTVKEGEAIIDRKVETGSISSLGQIEILSGLTEGDTIILKNAAK